MPLHLHANKTGVGTLTACQRTALWCLARCGPRIAVGQEQNTVLGSGDGSISTWASNTVLLYYQNACDYMGDSSAGQAWKL